MKKLYNILFSTRLTAILFLVFATSMGIATFIENDYGTQASKALVYNTWWFELIMIIFVGNFIGNIARYRLYRKEKWSVLLFHLAFILILIGAGITRYISFEAMMPIKEGETTNLMLSEKTYLTVLVDDGKDQKTIEKRYYFSPKPSSEIRFISLSARFLNVIRGGNHFSIKTNFRDKPYKINYVNYIPNAYEKLVVDNLEDSEGEEFLHFVESGDGGRHDHYIKKGEIANIHNVLVTFEKPIKGAINIFTDKDMLRIDTPFDGEFMVMATQEKGTVVKDSVQIFNLRSLYNIGEMQFVVPKISKGRLTLVSGDKDEHPEDMLEVAIVTENEKKNIKLFGNKYMLNPPEIFSLDGLNFRISYGAKQLKLPFSIKLRDFQLDRHPGSMSPKSYASEVTVVDNGENFDFRIFMNNILDHKGYRFFQSSYNDTGEVEETHLSVNHDFVGTWVTYIGYGLLFLGLLLILISKNTRFAYLRKQLDKIKKKKAALSVIILLSSLTSFAQDNHRHQVSDQQIDSILNTQKVSVEHAERFGKLIIQDVGGRMKPINTFTSELLRKVSKKDTYNGMDANQVAVSMVTNPRIWYSVPFIYMKSANSKVRDMLGLPEDQEYARLSDLFTDKGEYKLSEEVAKAHKKIIKNKFEQSIIDIDGRANLLYQAVAGSIFKFFPLQGDSNNKWFSYVEHREAGFKGTDSLYIANILHLYADGLKTAKSSEDYTKANKFLESIHKYQINFGGQVMPSNRKVELELFYNKYDIFKGLFKQYMLAGLLLFVLVIIQIFNNSKTVNLLVKISSLIIVALFIYQTIGLGIRWYISGHAPWSNGYESMIYISWATMLFGLIFGKKSSLTIAATAFVTSMLLMIAHWNWMDPSIGTLVPVLDSYWLMIHVSIIVASYGPFTLSMILGFIALILYGLTTINNKKKLDLAIKEITIINEMSMTVGLIMLTIGNFLGGIWANESWGRYWGWDPKETWALVSIMIYAFVLHMRLIPGLRSRFTFNIISIFSFTTILMTYLGVNHLLSGLHSYATGDSAPIPNEIWGWLIVSTVLSILAFVKYKKYYKK